MQKHFTNATKLKETFLNVEISNIENFADSRFYKNTNYIDFSSIYPIISLANSI